MNNPPAFPSPIDDIKDPRSGMTLRDYFAAHICAAMCVHNDTGAGYDKLAQWSYQQADALLKAREK